ncbi:hypothetical protein F2Q68_00011373 [Brassica cretica]|uniref:Uncharacterized protein n=1 Tax=Brassica cretica TaxID=69181 RepID=A0A3N6TKX4_BRACR|nr:hypothetical protein F2Q68_00011373 [Brassica cretica]
MELDEGEAEAAMAHAKRLIQSGGQRGDAKGHGGVHGGWFPRLRERGSIVLSSSKKGDTETVSSDAFLKRTIEYFEEHGENFS